MRRIYCLLLLGLPFPLNFSTAVAATDTPPTEHRTADGRLISLTRAQCRTLVWSRRPTGTDVTTDCLEAGIYDPCYDASSPSTVGTCYAAHLELAERRIKRAEHKLVQLTPEASEVRDTKETLSSARAQWDKRIDAYCKEQDRLSRKAEEEYGQQSRYPTGVDSGQDFSDCLIQEREEWARELESFVSELTRTRDGLQRIRVHGRLMDFLSAKSLMYHR